jgi:hypothetical protein
MSKGIVKSEIGDGKYSVEVQLEKGVIYKEIARLNQQIAIIEARIAGMPEGLEKEILKLRKLALQKRIIYLQNTNHVPENPTVDMWCADLTLGLAGNVGVVEIAGMRENGFNVQPGYEGNAVYDEDRDGQLKPALAVPAAGVYWNFAMQAGWQKWRPSYRWGIITAIDYDNDKCDVQLDPLLNADCMESINKFDTLENVSIQYMTCNAAAFEVADEVLIKFENNEWLKPKVVGFKEEPKGCTIYIVLRYGDKCTVWDTFSGQVADKIPLDGGGGMATFPCDYSLISEWVAGRQSVSASMLFSEESRGYSPLSYSLNYVYDGGQYTGGECAPECEADFWGISWASETRTGSNYRVDLFGGDDESVEHRWEDYAEHADPCGPSCPGYDDYHFSEIEESTNRRNRYGILLTPLNSGSTKIGFWTTRISNDEFDEFAYDYPQPPPTPWTKEKTITTNIQMGCGAGAGYTENGYFVPIAEQNQVKTKACEAGECEDWDDMPYNVTGDDPIYTSGWQLVYAAHYMADEELIAQFFIKKAPGDVEAYASIGADVTAEPYSVAKNDDATAALLALAQAADAEELIANYLR